MNETHYINEFTVFVPLLFVAIALFNWVIIGIIINILEVI
jgi:hypothetical protein